MRASGKTCEQLFKNPALQSYGQSRSEATSIYWSHGIGVNCMVRGAFGLPTPGTRRIDS